jgi:hypothetical protein
VIGEHEAAGGQRLLRVLLVAAQKDMLAGHLEAVRAAGLRPAGIDLNPIALLRALGPVAGLEEGAEGDGRPGQGPAHRDRVHRRQPERGRPHRRHLHRPAQHRRHRPAQPGAVVVTYTGTPTTRVVGRGLVDTGNLLSLRTTADAAATSLSTVASVVITVTVDLPSASGAEVPATVLSSRVFLPNVAAASEE